MTTIIPADFYATSTVLLDYPYNNNNTRNSFHEPPPKHDIHPTIYLYGICLVLIPTATILGNLLVIVSVLRFKALHSAINFLILGLAVADLFVALFVMPYAVYVYVQGGYWFLGPLMCDIYSASDVACSTASILLLAVISFDRYRAVSRPIQYSRQSQNIKRVVMIVIVIWLISFALASPMFLGVNNRPPDASPYECRFYNPEFSIGSSIVSFVIPCFIVLFVYIRIMMALRKREKAAKMRRQANIESGKKDSDFDHDEAGIVAGPDEHDLAGSSTPRSSSDSLSENVHVVTNDFVSEIHTSVSRRSSELDSFANNTISSFNSSHFHDKSDRSSTSDYKRSFRKIKQSFYFHRRSFTLPSVDICTKNQSIKEPFLPSLLRTISKRSPKIFRASNNIETKKKTSPQLTSVKIIKPDEDLIIKNETIIETPKKEQESETDKLIQSSIETETMSTTAAQSIIPSIESPSPTSLTQAIIRRTPMGTTNFERRKSSLPDCRLALTEASGNLGSLVIENENAQMETPKHVENKRLQKLQSREDSTTTPSVSFNIAGKTFFGGTRGPTSTSSAPFSHRRRSSCMETISDSNKASGSSCGLISSISSNVISSESNNLVPRHKVFTTKTRPKHSTSKHSMDSNPSNCSSTKTLPENKKKTNNSKINGSTTALAVRIVKRTINRKESSLKRKVTKAQRKERRATKTLGIVVGIFLICWVPFFTLNILNAICVLIEQPSCEVGFGPFFYTTWIGYMNSFMNPVIYTIFNTEFRRAFKSLLLGRNATRRHRARNV